jgi:hypothetical protein
MKEQKEISPVRGRPEIGSPQFHRNKSSAAAAPSACSCVHASFLSQLQAPLCYSQLAHAGMQVPIPNHNPSTAAARVSSRSSQGAKGHFTWRAQMGACPNPPNFNQ